jgi:hypothetical protein
VRGKHKALPYNEMPVCLSKIKSEYIRGAVRRGLGGKEYALPFTVRDRGASLSKAKCVRVSL